MTRPLSTLEAQPRTKAGFGRNDLLGAANRIPRSILAILLLLLITVLGGVLLLLDPHTSSPHELKAIGNRPLEAARPRLLKQYMDAER